MTDAKGMLKASSVAELCSCSHTMFCDSLWVTHNVSHDFSSPLSFHRPCFSWRDAQCVISDNVD